MKIALVLLASVLCFCACTNQSKKEGSSGQVKSAASQSNATFDSTKCLVIKGKSGVFLQYDSIEAAEMEKNGSLETVIDDMNYYQSTAEEELSNNGIASIYTEKECLCFITEKNDTFHLEGDTLDKGDLVLFNGVDKPLLSNSIAYADIYRGYYHLPQVKPDTNSQTDSPAKPDTNVSGSDL